MGSETVNKEWLLYVVCGEKEKKENEELESWVGCNRVIHGMEQWLCLSQLP